jgi:Anti-sigma factor NepR
MDGRYWDGPAARREGGKLDVKKEQPDKEQTIAARARQRAIGRELRRMYDDVVQEPVPEDFLELLKKIDAAKAKRDQAP